MRENKQEALDKERYLHYIGIHKMSYALATMTDYQDRVFWGLWEDKKADQEAEGLEGKAT